MKPNLKTICITCLALILGLLAANYIDAIGNALVVGAGMVVRAVVFCLKCAFIIIIFDILLIVFRKPNKRRRS